MQSKGVLLFLILLFQQLLLRRAETEETFQQVQETEEKSKTSLAIYKYKYGDRVDGQRSYTNSALASNFKLLLVT